MTSSIMPKQMDDRELPISNHDLSNKKNEILTSAVSVCHLPKASRTLAATSIFEKGF